MLRKQVECLAEENGKLVGHQNLHQKIQYVVRLKKENVRLAEVSSDRYLEEIQPGLRMIVSLKLSVIIKSHLCFLQGIY